MKKFIKKFDLFVAAFVIVIGSTVMVACQNTETKKVETETTMPVESKMENKDSMPVIDTSGNSSTKPETIKNQ